MKPTHSCPICQKEYKKPKWLLKHMCNLYPDQHWTIINGSVMKRGNLTHFFAKNNQNGEKNET